MSKLSHLSLRKPIILEKKSFLSELFQNFHLKVVQNFLENIFSFLSICSPLTYVERFGDSKGRAGNILVSFLLFSPTLETKYSRVDQKFVEDSLENV